MKKTLLIAIALAAVSARADNCGSESDCQAVPQNIDAATGFAAAGAGAAVVTAGAAMVARRREDEVDPVEFDPDEDEEEGSGTTGTLEDIFGSGESEEPPAEEPPVRRGPPDMALGEDPPSPPTDPDAPR